MHTKYKKRLLLRCIHHFKSDLINNMDHMRISHSVCENREMPFNFKILVYYFMSCSNI